MNCKTMMRCTALTLIVCVLFSGCVPAFSPSSGGKDIKKLAALVKRTQEEMLPSLNELIDWQISTVEAMIEEKAEYKERGEIYQPVDHTEEIAAYKEMCEGYLETVRERADKAAELGRLPDASLAAGKEYFARMENALERLLDIMVFDKDVETATEPVTSFSTRKFTDDWSRISAMYEAYKECVQNLGNVNCPAFMKQVYDRYVSTCNMYVTFIEQWVNAISKNDNLRYAASTNMYNRTVLFEEKYAMELTLDFNLQYEKTGERLNGSIQTLADELAKAAELNNRELGEFTYTYQKSPYSVDISYETAEKIFPSLYNSMDSILNFTALSDNGDLDVLVEAEIPGFTQLYSQTFTLTPQLTSFYVKPPLLTGELDLASAKDAQIIFTVTTLNGNDAIAKHSIPVRIMSKYDIEYWNDEFGVVTKDNYLCFLTPESTAIVELKRKAIEGIDRITGGRMQSFPGYQNVLGMDKGEEYYNTYAEVIGLQWAMSQLGVRYNMSPFSASGTEYLQRVLLPEDVLATKSGLCVETSLVLASAIQSAGMHAVLVFPTGHAQVAVETWQDSGEYFLLESTKLPFDGTDIEDYLTYYEPDEWAQYIARGTDGYGCYILDCDNAKLLGLSAMTN